MSATLATVTTLKPATHKRPIPASVKLYSTCLSSLGTGPEYPGRIAEIARWSEAAGCTGILVYTDNSLVDPWLVAQFLIQNTRTLCPLIAVQPVYMHPYAVAKMVSTLAFLHGRRVCLNMVAGGFKADLTSLNDTIPHDSRYKRLVEYTRVIQLLLNCGSPVTFEGEFYSVKGLTLRPTVSPDLCPEFLMSGSSEAGAAAAIETGATAIQYPEPPDQAPAVPAGTVPSGMRIGIVARARSEEAWQIARARFPESRTGQMTRQLASKASDSSWHQRLSEIGGAPETHPDTYWLQPFENYHTNCPYLVGSYGDVAAELASYLGLGYRTFILDIPAAEEEFKHTGIAFQIASRSAGLL